jgi:uncharacterized repeat protein (TIGR01451 family)/fimbrial isopeptide formation D2 family protein/LPXTG-motif cell wall-anchored protein
MVAVSLVVVPSAVSHAAGSITLNKTSAGSVLVGGTASFTLEAANPGTDEQYNLSFRDVLPPGTSYVSGSTTPAGAGDPQVITLTDPVTSVSHQVLIWANISDLTTGSTQSISYEVKTDAAVFPLGSTVTNAADAYASSDAREVPDFTDAGEPVSSANVVTAHDTATTSVTAIKIAKSSSGTPEGELVRGVNDHQAVYTLTVTNNSTGPSSGGVVTDYLPAGLEYLGCGGPFNSTTPEYAGASNTVQPVTGCKAPTSVETVNNPAGYPEGVYTKVVWNIPSTLAPGGTYTVSYAAGVPQRANTMTFTGGTPNTTGAQAANLDNNVGASTRDTGTGLSLTNSARVDATYDGKAVSDTVRETVVAKDLVITKSVSPTTFEQGEIATYTLVVNTSEYSELSDLEITDVIPAGLCPVDDTKNWTTLSECAAGAGYAPTGATITAVTANSDGSFTVTLTPDATSLNHNGTSTITYKALMRHYFDDAKTSPTSAKDAFTNAVSIQGTSVPRTDVDSPDTGAVTVPDTSSATIESNGPAIRKLRMRNATPMVCSTDLADYVPEATDDAPFTEGDRVCFLLQVTFPVGVDTRNPQLTDFLPPNVSYETSTVIAGSPASTVSVSGSSVVFTLGSGTPRVVAGGSVFTVVISGIVTKPVALSSGKVTKTLKENLAKFRYTNSKNQSMSLRDAVDVPLGPPPPIGIAKGVQSVNGTTVAGGASPGGVDNVPVGGGDDVVFRIDVTNLAALGSVNGDTIMAPDVWDVLPAGVTCAAISSVSDGGQCYDQTTPGRPNVAGNSTSSVIRWALPQSYTLTPEQTRTITYTMKVPAVISVSSVLNNTAAVASFASATNRQDTTPYPVAIHNPQNNISADVAAADMDVPAASDPSSVYVPDAAVTKTKVTGITDTNNTNDQAVIGETVLYTISLRIPAHSSVFNGKLSDALPAGIVQTGNATAAYSPTGTSPASEALPAGVTLTDADASGDLDTLIFPAGAYTNTSANTELFEVTIPARMATTAGTHGQNLTNVASFVSFPDATSTTAWPARTGSSTVMVVEPSPTLTKGRTPTGNVSGGQTLTYTLTARNANGRPTLRDSVVVDCVPSGLTVVAGTPTVSAGSVTTQAPDATNGCAAGTTAIVWTLGNLVGQSSVAPTLTYQAQVTGSPAGAQTYVNNATLTGSSLLDGVNGSANERVYTAKASNTVTVAGPTVSKSALLPNPTIGERETWTIGVFLPPNIAFHNAIVTDVLPAGLTNLSIDAVTCSPSCEVPGTSLTSSGLTIGWLLGELPATASSRSVLITYSATIADVAGNASGTALKNTAAFKWNLVQSPTNPSSVTATMDKSQTAAATVTVAEPQVAVDKSVSDTTVEPGQSVTYTLAVTNARTDGKPLSTAYGVVVTDTVPAGVVVTPGTISDGGQLTGADAVTGAGGTITWTISPLNPNATKSLTYKATLAPSASLTSAGQTNVAAVTRYTSLDGRGRVYAGGTDNVTITPQFPKVTVAKTVAAGPAYLGQPKTWTVTATNTGGAAGQHVSITDTLPENWTYQANSARVVVAGGSAVAKEPTITTVNGHVVLTWSDLGTIPSTDPDSTAVVTFAAIPTDPAAAQTPGVGSGVSHTNTAGATAQDATGATGNKDGSYAGPDATASTHIDSADLRIVKTSGDAVAGTDLIYTLQVSNAAGGDTAVGPFTVTDPIPSGLGSVTATGDGWTCSVVTTGTPHVTCVRESATETLASGSSFPDITVTAAIPASAATGTKITNTATVAASTYDPDHTNNTSTVEDTVTRQADLSIVKAVSGTVVAGQSATYTLNVHNAGPSDTAGPLVVSDTIPAGTSFVTASGAGWQCGAASGTVTCRLASGLASGASASQIVLVLTVDSSRTADIVNTASVSGPDPDPVPGNNSSTVTSPVTTSADLSLVKTHSGAFTPGTDGEYVFAVTNAGPSDAAAQVKVTDTLPSGVTYNSVTSGGWTCSMSGQLMTCVLDAGGLASGASSTFRVSVSVAANHQGDVTNTARVESPTHDPVPGNNVSTDTTSPVTTVDLAISKKHTATAVAGASLDFTLTVSNEGPSDDQGTITVSDPLPSGMTLETASGTGWDCSASTATQVACSRAGGLAHGETADEITVTVRIAADAGPATVTNVATVAGTNFDPDTSNNRSSDEVRITDLADIVVTKAADPSTVTAGTNVTFTIAVSNDGPSDADAVAIVDPMPTGLSLVSVDPPDGWQCTTTNPVRCTVGTLAAGASATIRVTALLNAGVPDGSSIDNVATGSTSTPESSTSNNTGTATITTRAVADLSITKSHPTGVVDAGTSVTFTLGVHNDGPSDAARDVVVTDTLPVGMTYVTSGGAWACTAATPGDDGQVVTCTLSQGSLAAKTSAPDLTITAQVDAEITPEHLQNGTLTNEASVTSPTTDPDPSNNVAQDVVQIEIVADVSIVKSHTGAVRIGDDLVFTLQVHNAGPSDAREVTVTDTLPEGLTYVSADGGESWSCGFADGELTCDLAGLLDPGTDAPAIHVTVTVEPGAYPEVSNTAKVDSATTDEKPENNSSTDTVQVPPQVDLSVTKTHTPEPARVGTQVTYTVTVANAGPTVDPGPVTVTDVLPLGLTFVSGTGEGWTCSAVGQAVTCTRPEGLGIASSVITLVVDLGAAAYPKVTNTVSVTSPAEDLDPANNTASDPMVVEPLYKLTIEKSLTSISRQQAVWNLTVHNAGPNPAPKGTVVVTDTLPSVLTFASASAQGWTCRTVSATVTCAYDSELGGGRSATVKITTTVASGATGTVTNTAKLPDGQSAQASGKLPPSESELAQTGSGELAFALVGMVTLGLGIALVRRRRR